MSKFLEIKQGIDTYDLKFPYDPDLISLVKNVPGRRWEPAEKIWSIPKNNLGMLINQLKGTKYESKYEIKSEEHINENDTLDSTPSAEIPDIDISNVTEYVEEGHHLYHHQEDFLKYAIDRENKKNFSGFLCCDEMGCGKAVTLDTKILTPTGYKEMKDIEVGDSVIDMYGNVQSVLKTYDHDNLKMYKITFSDGATITCCEDHQWVIKYREQKEWSVVSTKDLLNSSFVKENVPTPNSERLKDVRIPIVEPVNFEEKPVPLDPWLFGYLLGRGCFNNKGVRVTIDKENEPEIWDTMLESIPYDCELHPFSRNDNNYQIRIKSSPIVYCVEDEIGFSHLSDADFFYGMSHGCLSIAIRRLKPEIGEPFHCYGKTFKILKDHFGNTVTDVIRKLGLLTKKSGEKFIPDCYKWNSVEVRLAVLQGIMDANGYVNVESRTYHFVSSSKQLRDDVAFLAQSLGFLTTLRTNTKGNYIGYLITFMGQDSSLLYQHNRKLAQVGNKSRGCRRRIKSIEYVGELPGKCITVSGPSSTYVCDNFIVTHNTIEGLNLALYNRQKYGFQHCLIICCANSAKYSWTTDIKRHTNDHFRGYILGSRPKKKSNSIDTNKGTKEKFEDLITGHIFGDENLPELPYFIIMNIEAIRGEIDDEPVIYEELLNWINKGKIQMIIIDEIHKGASPSSQQGKLLLKLKEKATKPVMYLPMTGTPITKSPLDLFVPLKLIGATNVKNYYLWSRTYCLFGGYGNYEVVGYKNIPQLKSQLQGNMIRRKRSEVLDLPSKIEFTEYVDNTPIQEKLYLDVAHELLEEKEEILQLLNPMTKLLKLRQVNGCPELIDDKIEVDKNYPKKNAKVQRVLELLEDIKARDEKVVIFSTWLEPLRALKKYLSTYTDYKCCFYTGTMETDVREKNKQVFITNPEYTIMMGTVGALGVSHTLTVANNVIFLDEPWNMSDKTQAEDRCNRIGQTKPVNIYTIITKNTVDERVHDILNKKQGISDYIVDNDELNLRKNPKLFELLLRDSIETRK